MSFDRGSEESLSTKANGTVFTGKVGSKLCLRVRQVSTGELRWEGEEGAGQVKSQDRDSGSMCRGDVREAGSLRRACLPHHGGLPASHWRLQHSSEAWSTQHLCCILPLCLAQLPFCPEMPPTPGNLLILLVSVQVSPPPCSLTNPCLDSSPFTACLQLRSRVGAGCLCSQPEPRACSRAVLSEHL